MRNLVYRCLFDDLLFQLEERTTGHYPANYHCVSEDLTSYLEERENADWPAKYVTNMDLVQNAAQPFLASKQLWAEASAIFAVYERKFSSLHFKFDDSSLYRGIHQRF